MADVSVGQRKHDGKLVVAKRDDDQSGSLNKRKHDNSRSALSVEDLHEFAVAEIYNSVTGFPFYLGRDEALLLMGHMGQKRKLVYCVASDD